MTQEGTLIPFPDDVIIVNEGTKKTFTGYCLDTRFGGSPSIQFVEEVIDEKILPIIASQHKSKEYNVPSLTQAQVDVVVRGFDVEEILKNVFKEYQLKFPYENWIRDEYLKNTISYQICIDSMNKALKLTKERKWTDADIKKAIDLNIIHTYSKSEIISSLTHTSYQVEHDIEDGVITNLKRIC